MSRPDSTRRAARGLTLAALLAALPFAPAHAQFGKLIKKAAQGAAQGAAEGAARNAASGGAGGRSESRGESLVPITAESIDLLLAALGPSAQAATQYEAARARYDAASQKREAHVKCRDDVKKQAGKIMTMPPSLTTEAQVAYGKRSGELSERMAAAQQAGDTRRVHIYIDSLAMLGEKLENDMIPALAKCGPYASDPGESPNSPDLAPPKVPAGMTATQFGRLRERVAAWILTDGKYKVQPDEQGALESRSQQLAPLAPLFRGNALAWSSWGDLK